MDKTSNPGNAERPAGLIQKAAQLSAQEVTAEELKAINKYTMEPLAAEDVFTFRAVLCDNDLDRSFERFSLKALQSLQKLFLGKTVIKNHSWNADDQVARIYGTELVHSDKLLGSGEPYTQLVARCYMLRTESNADLIADIKGGIKKEGSVGVSVSSSICSICGTDNAKSYCRHWAGKTYEKEGGAQVCTFTLADAKDAYEFSLVAVPAQRMAGVSKSYTGETVFATAEDLAEQTPEEQTPEEPANDETAKALELRARLAGVKSKLTPIEN